MELDQTSEPADPSEKRRDHLRLLAMEGDENLRALLSLHLSWLGHHAHFAEDVAAALQLTAQETFDLLLGDSCLPDGGDLLCSLMASGNCPPAAAATSGDDKAQDLTGSAAAGRAPHLVKLFPFQASEWMLPPSRKQVG